MDMCNELAMSTPIGARWAVLAGLCIALATGPSALAQGAAGPAASAPAPAEEPETTWNAMQGEKLQALRATGDAARGEITFEVCQGCHRAKALGRPDGSYPRLAGQHASVLIKQMTDVRAGRRRNGKMLPFIDKHGVGPQDIADIAAYLSRLPVPPTQGQGPGTHLADGEKLYKNACVDCHGAAGEGDATRFYPRVNGQHFKYTLREMIDIRDGVRRNANPTMVEAIKRYTNADLEAVADHMSRLPVTGAR